MDDPNQCPVCGLGAIREHSAGVDSDLIFCEFPLASALLVTEPSSWSNSSMQNFRVHSLILGADETVRTTLLISDWVKSAGNSIWRCRALLPLGCAVLFVVGCAHTSFLQRPLASASNRSIATLRSNDTPAKKGAGLGSTRIVMASWYGPGYDGKRTSSGERFDPNRLTAASRTLPLDSIVRVTNLRNGRSVEVKVNDRGPRTRKRGLDLSPAAARRIGLTHRGVGRVKITPVMNPTMNE
jgi:hypothetical protein